MQLPSKSAHFFCKAGVQVPIVHDRFLNVQKFEDSCMFLADLGKIEPRYGVTWVTNIVASNGLAREGLPIESGDGQSC